LDTKSEIVTITAPKPIDSNVLVSEEVRIGVSSPQCLSEDSCVITTISELK